MPPKRASTRRAGSAARPVDFQNSPSYLPNVLSPEANNPALPDIPVKHSFAYGASSAPLLPRKLAAKPNLGLTEVADAIDQDIKSAQNREDERPQRNTRSRASVSASMSPVRRSRREPTPDQIQLIDSLNRATVSPQGGQSTPTPTPPIPHTLSTTSSPATQTLMNPRHAGLQAEDLYPSPLLRAGSPGRNNVSLSSPNFRGSVDNDSLVSWGVERDIHGDDLQRTHTRYRPEPQGTNITAPPRRFSGLAFGHSTIEEEEEPDSVVSQQSPSPELSPQPQPKVEPQPEPEPESESEPELVPEPEPQPQPQPRSVSRSVSRRSRSNARSESAQPAPAPAPAPFTSSARVRTIIPNRITRETSYRQTHSPIRERTKRTSPLPNDNQPSNKSTHSQKVMPLRIISYIILIAMSIFTVYSFGDNLLDISSDICSHIPWGNRLPPINLNSTGMEAVASLSNQMMRMGAQVSSLSRDLKDIRSEVDNRPAAVAPTTIIQRTPPVPEAPRINFLSVGMGALINPYRTSPAVSPPPKWHDKFSAKFQRLSAWFGRGPKSFHPAVAALVPWEDVGDCYCSAPLSGTSQIAVSLGRPIVPEEVVVEHIPKSATLRPELAPADMELWVEYSVIGPNVTSSTKTSDSFFSGVSLHKTIMNALRVAYRGEPETAYSGDELLGDSYYRIGKWKYDIDGASNVQRFDLDAILDIPALRVEHVVFRVKSNWGANQTCIYRLKLFGHL